MSSTSNPHDQAAEKASTDLARVQAKVVAARHELASLLHELVLAEQQLSNHTASHLLEANEQLMLASLRHQSEADTASQALTEVTRAAERDPLTQLPNRVLLTDRVVQAIANAKRRHGHFALLFLDLDNFKAINDSFGHGIGDEVLQEVARRLVATVRDVDTVSRHCGDEFLVLLPELAQASDATLIAGKLLTALAAPCRIGHHELQLSASIGVAIYPEDGKDAKTLISRADTAMYRNKRRGLDRLDKPDGRPPG